MEIFLRRFTQLLEKGIEIRLEMCNAGLKAMEAEGRFCSHKC